MEPQSQEIVVASGSPAEVPNDPGKMFIGGLSWQTSPGMSVAIWKHPEHGFFLFDAAPSDDEGRRIRNTECVGYACLIRSAMLDGIIDAFSENLNFNHDSRYCIDNVTLIKVKPICRPMCDGKCPPTLEPCVKTSQIKVDNKTLKSLNPLDLDETKYDCTKQPNPKPRRIPPEDELAIVQKIPLKIEMTNYMIEAKFANVPLIDQFIKDDTYDYEDTKVNVPQTLRLLPNDPDVAILHGWTHAADENYKAKEAAVTACCVMAMAYKKFYPVRTWVREQIDEVIRIGNLLYEEVRSLKPKIVQLTTADLNDFHFKVEDNKIIFDTDMLTLVGTIVSKKLDVLDLKGGLEKFFLKNTDGILESEPNTVAIWLENDYYYMFDSIQSDFNGLHLKKSESSEKGKGKKDDNKEKKPMAKSCIMRFATQSALFNRLISNVDPLQNFSRYSIKRIGILDDIPGMRSWFDYKPGELGKSWILQGNLNADGEYFDDRSRGVQGLALHIAALVTLKLVQPRLWYKLEVDDTLREGDAYYKYCVPALDEDNDAEETLSMSNLKRFMYYNKRKAEIKAQEDVLYGELKLSAESKNLNLLGGLSKFFETYACGIVESNEKYFAVWKFEEVYKGRETYTEMGYYVFIPQPTEAFMKRFVREIPEDIARDSKMGDNNPVSMEQNYGADSFACVLRYLDLGELASALTDLFAKNSEDEDSIEGVRYSIHDVQIIKISEPMTDEEIEKDKEEPVMPEFKAYKAKGEHGAVLLGSFVQNDETLFKRDTRDKQQACNAIVALGMSKLYNSHLWKFVVVDDILRLGNQMTEENLDNFPPGDVGTNEEGGDPRDYILPSEIDHEFNIGANQITIEIDESVQSGKLGDLSKIMEDFFAGNRFGIFRLQEIIMPIWKEEINSTFFAMDPRGFESGKAAVYWSLTLQELAQFMYQCVDSEKQDNDSMLVNIDGVTITNTIEKSEQPEPDDITDTHWYNFNTVEKGVWKIDCGITLEDERFNENYRGLQKAAVSVMAIVFAKVYEPRHWSTEVCDEVVITGDKLHARSAARLGYTDSLLPRDMVTEFFISNRRINLEMLDAVEAGTILSQNPEIRGISCGISHFFREYSSGCLIIDGSSIFAIWKYEDYIYVFEPGVNLMRYESAEPLIERFKQLGDLDFEFTMIEIVDWNKLPPWKYDPSAAVRPSNLPPLNAYHKLPTGKARAILHGTTHEFSEIFAKDIRGHQTAANCMVSLAMTVIKNPVTWTKMTLDEILVLGVTLQRESMSHACEDEGKTLKPVELKRIFKLGGTVIASDICCKVVSGTVLPPPPPPPEEKGAKGKKRDSSAKKKKDKKAKEEERPQTPPPPPVYLEEGLKKFFEIKHAGILVVGECYMVALWRDSGVYFVYDPKPKTALGLPADHDDVDAKSCVTWFACLEPLYDLIIANIPKEVKYDAFEICSVITKTIVLKPLPLPATYKPVIDDKLDEKPADYSTIMLPKCAMEERDKLKVDLESCFKRVNKELSVMLGTIHIGMDIFPEENIENQSTAVAMIAVAVSALHAPSTWTPAMIDAILKQGDTFHTECARFYGTGRRNLCMEEVFDTFIVGDVRVTVLIFRNFAAGITLEPDLRNALECFFCNNTCGVFHTTHYSVGIMVHWGKYYFLDPTERNKFKKGFEGAACLVKCESLCKLSQTIIRVLSLKGPTVYSLNVVKVKELRFFNE